uniref:Reverse transcriptase zinc-binding domain-containing protein n=1 Tax=Fagus sylvatica TaxID=28930 RepID=A0A2N9I9L7_FAGSY
MTTHMIQEENPHIFILTADNLRRRGIPVVSWCCMCKADGESIDHLLLHCPYAKELWDMVLGLFGLHWVMPKTVTELLHCWFGSVGGHSVIWKAIPHCIMWCLWQERNARTFEDSACDEYSWVFEFEWGRWSQGGLYRSRMALSVVAGVTSRVGPVEWLKPYTDETIVELGQKGVKSLLAVPISFVSEHIETLEEIDVEYKELALRSGIEKWGRVPALGCEPTFISDLADAVIESLPYVGAMAVSNLEARQSLVPLGSVEELLAAYDSQRRELPPLVTMWEWGWTKSAETWNGRAAMLAVLVLLVLEVTTGEGFLHQWGILPLFR